MKKSLKLLNFFILFSFTIILFGCGYEPLLGEKYQIYGIEKTNVTGDRRLGQILINNLTVSKTKEKKAILNVNASKSKSVSDRSKAGKIKEYTVDVSFDVELLDSGNRNVLVKKQYIRSGTYNASVLHLDTLNSEKKIVNNLTKSVAEQIMNELGLIQN
jgi:outer membrane lipopolysaccharide assembly protein LptE/RlpB|tara:strand:- start:3 stop:479 length:477 start_codon:yes stop_codon:yes gene_type:complete